MLKSAVPPLSHTDTGPGRRLQQMVEAERNSTIATVSATVSGIALFARCWNHWKHSLNIVRCARAIAGTVLLMIIVCPFSSLSLPVSVLDIYVSPTLSRPPYTLVKQLETKVTELLQKFGPETITPDIIDNVLNAHMKTSQYYTGVPNTNIHMPLSK